MTWQGPVAVSSEHGNELRVPWKAGKFLDQLSEYQFLKKDSAPWSWLVTVTAFWEIKSSNSNKNTWLILRTKYLTSRS
jgi:hypothetical protein